MEGKKLTQEEILEIQIKSDNDKLYPSTISIEDYAGGTNIFIKEDICIKTIKVFSQSQLEEIRDKVERLSSPYKTAEWYIKISDVLEILKPYIDGK